MNFNRIKAIMIKEWKRIFREPATLFMVLLFPIILTLTFSLAFGNMGTTNTTYTIGVVDQDNGQPYDNWATEFIDNMSSTKILIIQSYPDNQSAQSDLKQGKISAIVIIPDNFGSSIHSMLSNYSNPQVWENTTVILYTDAGSIFAQQAIPPIIQNTLITTIYGPTQTIQSSVKITSNSIGNDTGITGFDTMAPGIFVFATMFLTMTVAQSLVSEREKGILKRMNTTPTTSTDIISSQTLAQIVIAVIQAVLIFLFATITGYSSVIQFTGMLMLIVFIMIYSVTTVGLGLITAAISKNGGAATGISFLFIIPQLMLGSFVPVPSHIGRFTPSYYVTDALTTLLTRGGSPISPMVLTDLLIVSAISIIVFIIGIIIYKKTQK